ncbi:MAG: FtsX-like permease family protein [Planctomycetota bacterium]|nr:MAG: FtsX-like permease family protein [Planctomycetota bacterium]
MVGGTLFSKRVPLTSQEFLEVWNLFLKKVPNKMGMRIFLRSLRNLGRSRVRSFLTVLGVSIGIYAMVVMGALAEYLHHMVEATKVYVGGVVHLVTKTDRRGENPGVSRQELERIEALEEVEMVSPFLVLLLDGFNLEERPLSLFTPQFLVGGLDPRMLRSGAQGIRLVEGRWLREGDDYAALVTRRLLRKRHLRLGGKVKIRHKFYTIVGVIDVPSLPTVPDAFVPYQRLRSDFERPSARFVEGLLEKELGPSLWMLASLVFFSRQGNLFLDRLAFSLSSKILDYYDRQDLLCVSSEDMGRGVDIFSWFSVLKLRSFSECVSPEEFARYLRKQLELSLYGNIDPFFLAKPFFFASFFPRDASGFREGLKVKIARRIIHGIYGRYYPYYILPKRGSDLSQLIEKVRKIAPKAAVVPPKKLVAEVERAMMLFTLIMVCVGLISSVVAGLLIINTLVMSILERKREIGIKKAIGASNLQIVGEFLSESALIGLFGGGIGVVLGVLSIWLANPWISSLMETGHTIFRITPRLVVGVFVFALVLSCLAGMYPAYKAARLDPVETLRNL